MAVVFARHFNDVRGCEIEVDSTFLDLKIQIAKAWPSLTPSTMRVSYQSEELDNGDDHKTLADLGICPETTVCVDRKPIWKPTARRGMAQVNSAQTTAAGFARAPYSFAVGQGCNDQYVFSVKTDAVVGVIENAGAAKITQSTALETLEGTWGAMLACPAGRVYEFGRGQIMQHNGGKPGAEKVEKEVKVFKEVDGDGKSAIVFQMDDEDEPVRVPIPEDVKEFTCISRVAANHSVKLL